GRYVVVGVREEGVSQRPRAVPQMGVLLLQETRNLRLEKIPVRTVAEARHADTGMNSELNQIRGYGLLACGYERDKNGSAGLVSRGRGSLQPHNKLRSGSHRARPHRGDSG